MPSRSFFCYNHQGKADAYVKALTARGWTLVKDPGKARFILSDSDVYHRGKALETYARRGKKIFLYPHASQPNIFWDFPNVPFSKHVNAHFVVTEGHAEIMRLHGVPYKMVATGWHLCPIVHFRPREKAKRILFGPIHPNSNGFLCRLDRDLNVAAFRKLLSLQNDDTTLTVRYIRELEQNGIWKAGGVEYIQGHLDLSYQEIDQADLVIGHQTFAYMAVARGVPTLMIGEWHTPRWGPSEEKLISAKSYDRYKHLLMYPLDILADGNPCALIERAIRSDDDIADWRERLIGQPFDGNHFVDLVEGLL